MLTASEQPKIKNLPELLENVRLRGGAIVEYEHVVSAAIIGQRMPYYEWVGPGASRRVAGLKHAALCLFLGWWSVPGLFWTPMALVQNLTGGLNATEVFVTADGVLARAGVLQEERAQLRRVWKVVLFVWLAVLAGLVAYAMKNP